MMDLQRVNGYDDPRFPQEVLHQHGAFLADGVPWAFRVVSDRGAVVTTAQPITPEALAEQVWGALDPENKVSLFVRFVNLAEGTHRDVIRNRY